jgi:hypothetical protein
MKTILKYSDSEDDQFALRRALRSTDMASLLFDIQRNMKARFLYELEDDNATEAEYALLDKIWENINEEFEAHDINIDHLIN